MPSLKELTERLWQVQERSDRARKAISETQSQIWKRELALLNYVAKTNSFFDAQRELLAMDLEQAKTDHEKANADLSAALDEIHVLKKQIRELKGDTKGKPIRNERHAKVQEPMQCAKAWQEQVLAAFRDYAALQEFPEPPANLGACHRIACRVQNRSLNACPCQIRAVLQYIGDCKSFRLRFHPDLYSRCRDDLRDGFQKKASEIFVVADAMYREQKGRR